MAANVLGCYEERRSELHVDGAGDKPQRSHEHDTRRDPADEGDLIGRFKFSRDFCIRGYVHQNDHERNGHHTIDYRRQK